MGGGGGGTFFGVPFKLVFLRMPLSCVHGDALAFDGADESLASPAQNKEQAEQDPFGGGKESKAPLVVESQESGGGLPVDVGAQDVEHGREAIIGGE